MYCLSIKELILLALSILALLPSIAFSDNQSQRELNRAPLQPVPCVGDFQHFNTELARSLRSKMCPADSAFFGAEIGAAHRNAPGEEIPLSGTCCPLPATDILTEESLFAGAECPKDYIATGVNLSCKDKGETKNCIKPIRCTKINTERYMMSEAQSGHFWGFNVTYWKQGPKLMKRDIPLAIRHSLGRKEKHDWQNSGCVAYPFGSLLYKKTSKRCKGLGFRQLQYAGIPGDPQKNTPVQMFPECGKLSSIFEQNPTCSEK